MSNTDAIGDRRAIRLADYRPPDFVIDTVDLHFEIRPGETVVRSRLQLQRRSGGRAEAPLVLDGVGLELLDIAIDGATLASSAYAVEPATLTIPTVPDSFELTTTVRIRPEDNTSLEGLYKGSACYCTQCEAEGFRHITFYLDRPDVLARFTTTIVGDRATLPVLLSNGNQVASAELADGRHSVTWEDPHRKPCYLFALVAGDLQHIADQFVTCEGRRVDLRIYTTAENIDKCDHAMVSLKKAMRWDEEVFGLACDLDNYNIVVTDDFNMGAMENKGLNIFNSKFVLARPDTATDDDYAGIERVIAHEYFHNWTGNRVTCRDWFQLSLKEGLTVFRDQLFSGAMNSPAIQRIDDVRMLRNHQFSEDAGPMAHPVRPASVIEINNFYTVTVYEKGAEVVRMYHTLLGADGFRRGMDLYFERFDGQAVTCDDFRQAMADASQRDLEQFARWYSQAGTPTVRVRARYQPAERTYTLHLAQSGAATPGLANDQPFHLPIAVGLVDRSGTDRLLDLGDGQPAATTRVLELTQTEQSFTFLAVDSEPVPSLLRGFSAPIHLEYDYSDEDLALLMAADSDPFARYDASQKLILPCLKRLIADHQAGRALALPDHLVAAYRAVLGGHADDPALAAELLALPTESYLGDQLAVIDVDAVFAVRRFARRTLATALRAEFEATYRSCRTDEPYRFEAASVARRRLQATCLGYLMELGDDAIEQLCVAQFHDADNMTEVMSALANLCYHGTPGAAAALQTFHDRWGTDSLVLDKWFAIQATSPQPGALERVRNLLDHPGFSIKKPNKVRALIGAFCGQNRIHFHGRDGSGYAFLADHVLELDTLNPQLAARMCSLFNHWKRFDDDRRALMHRQLTRIVETPQLSRDVYEIAAKALA